jgi:hypothetical protein
MAGRSSPIHGLTGKSLMFVLLTSNHPQAPVDAQPGQAMPGPRVLLSARGITTSPPVARLQDIITDNPQDTSPVYSYP